MSTNAYPMDLDSLQKGQLITVKELEFILAVNPQKKEAFEFAVMGLQALIHSRTELTAMIAKDGLRILTDEQASIHNGRERDMPATVKAEPMARNTQPLQYLLQGRVGRLLSARTHGGRRALHARLDRLSRLRQARLCRDGSIWQPVSTLPEL
jgi:hypothetical protein